MSNSRTHFAAATTGSDVADQFVVSVDMKVGAYIVANSGAMPTEGARHVTASHTSTDTTDTLGTLVVVGKNLANMAITETLTPVADDVVEGTEWFASITSVTGVGWVVDGTEHTKDKITVGCGEDVAAVEGTGTLHSVSVNTTAAGAITLSDAAGTLAVLPASVDEDNYTYDVTFSGFLGVALGDDSDITVIHSGSRPTVYSMA